MNYTTSAVMRTVAVERKQKMNCLSDHDRYNDSVDTDTWIQQFCEDMAVAETEGKPLKSISISNLRDLERDIDATNWMFDKPKK